MFHDIFDENEETYPVEGSLEQKAAYTLEQVRRSFFIVKKNYIAQKAGGVHHTATLQAFGPKAAEILSKRTEEHFAAFCANGLLTPEGETTDPRFPVDKMINAELRRIRSSIIVSVSSFMHQFDTMMPDELDRWTYSRLYFNLEPYKFRYLDNLYEDINVVIPKKKMPPRSVSDLEELFDEIATKYSDKNIHADGTRTFVLQRIRDTIIEFLLVDIPFTNRSLEKKQLVNDIDELQKKNKGDVPILH